MGMKLRFRRAAPVPHMFTALSNVPEASHGQAKPEVEAASQAEKSGTTVPSRLYVIMRLLDFEVH